MMIVAIVLHVVVATAIGAAIIHHAQRQNCRDILAAADRTRRLLAGRWTTPPMPASESLFEELPEEVEAGA